MVIFSAGETLWPKIAAHFDMAVGGVRPMHAQRMDQGQAAGVGRDRSALRTCASHALDDVADWHFADFHWAHGYDVCSSPEKLRRAGFPVTLDSEQAILGYLARYREARILP